MSCHIALVGSPRGGKTCIASQLSSGKNILTSSIRNHTYESTMGVSRYRSTDLGQGDESKPCIFYEFSGRDSYSNYGSEIYRKLDKFLLVIDMSNLESSLDYLKKKIKLINETCQQGFEMTLVFSYLQDFKRNVEDEELAREALNLKETPAVIAFNDDGSISDSLRENIRTTKELNILSKEEAENEFKSLPAAFKKSYDKLWGKPDIIEAKFISVLNDYAKGDSTLTLFFTCHLNRNRQATKAVNDIVKNMLKEQATLSEAFEALSKIPMKKNGSLHSRFIYIKQKLIEGDLLDSKHINLSPCFISTNRYFKPRP